MVTALLWYPFLNIHKKCKSYIYANKIDSSISSEGFIYIIWWWYYLKITTKIILVIHYFLVLKFRNLYIWLDKSYLIKLILPKIYQSLTKEMVFFKSFSFKLKMLIIEYCARKYVNTWIIFGVITWLFLIHFNFQYYCFYIRYQCRKSCYIWIFV